MRAVTRWFDVDGEWHKAFVADLERTVTKTDLEHLPKRKRDDLYAFLDGYRVWLVQDDFVDSEQSPAVLFVGDKAIGAFDLESWPDAVFEFWKQVLEKDAASMAINV